MKKFLIIIILVGFVQTSLGQTVESVLEKYTANWFKSDAYSVRMNYKLYESYTGTKVLEEMKGYAAKTASDYYTKIDNTEFVFSKKFTLKISHNEKAIVITDPSISDAAVSFNLTNSFLKYFTSEKIEDKGNYWNCVLKIKEGTQAPYETLELQIRKNDYMLQKQVLYFAKVMEHGYNGKEQYQTKQRLEITFNEFSTDSKKIDINKLKATHYLEFKNNEWTPKSGIQGYKLINLLTDKRMKL